MGADVSRTASVTADEDTSRLRAGLLAGDSQAHQEVCTRYGRDLHRFLTRRLGDDDLAEELMVQALADAVRHIARFNPRVSTLRAWLFGIARRHLQTELRLRARRKSVPPSAQVPVEAIAEQAGPENLAAESASRIQAQRQVGMLAAALSEIEMEVLTLRYGHDLSVREVGQVVGRSEKAVESLLIRAKQKARERLGCDDE
jgi:RNA polymerase sigma-70 factor (ECF subfamily)